jgi:nicotinate-nucleotide pyrophosphorylase (carboxylating)
MMSAHPAALPRHVIERTVQTAFAEDLGEAGDITSQATIGPDATAVARINARSAGVICGLDCAIAAFSLIGPGLETMPFVADGAVIGVGDAILEVRGNARNLLAAERTALNFLTHLSGVATLTRSFVLQTEGTDAHICCTRKTTPGLRALEKYAVRCGGGHNHRFGLNDAILIKDNHIAVAGGVAQAIAAAKAFAGHLVAIEVEVDTLGQLEEALASGVTAILLDNMDEDTLAQAVAITAGRAKLEASGNVTLERIAAIARTGVDYISTSRITTASTPLDLGLDISID